MKQFRGRAEMAAYFEGVVTAPHDVRNDRPILPDFHRPKNPARESNSQARNGRMDG